MTVGDRILVLLLNYTRYMGELQAPIDITQDGIADKLGIIRSAVPRAVGSLITKGMVEEHLAHIHGLPRRRKVYLLTDDGILKGRALLDELGATKIEVIDRGERKKETLSVLLASGEVDLRSLSEVLSCLVLDKGKPKVQEEEKKGWTSYVHSLSPPEIFLDRERETSEITNAISSKKRKVTVVYGIAGVGKTTLSWKITQIFQKDMNIFYIDLKEWTTIGYLLKEMSSFLSRSGWDALKGYIESTKDVDLEAVCDLLKTIPPEAPMLFIFDDLHRAPVEITSFMTSLKERLPAMKNVNVIVLSRQRAQFYDVRDVRINNLVGELELLGFDRETSRKFLTERGFRSDEVDAIIERTGGHPLALVLVEREGYKIDVGDFDDFLKAEIFSKLPKGRAKVLGLLSLSRLTLGEDDLRRMIETDEGTITSLMDGHLVFGTPGGYMVHDLIRDQAVNFMTADERVECHKALSELFHEKLSSLGFYQDIGPDVPPYPFGMEDETGLGPAPLYVSEEIHHLLGAKDPLKAMNVIIKAVMQIPSKDLVKEHAGALLSSLPKDMSKEHRVHMDFIKATSSIFEGDFKSALETMRGLSKAQKGGDDLASSIRDCSRLWLPYLEEKVNGPDSALKALEDISTENVPLRLRYYFLVTKAALRYKMGDHSGASAVYREFLQSLLACEELPVLLKDSIKASLEKAEMGSIHDATDNFQKILNLTQTNRDILREELPYVDVDHHLLSAIYSLYYGRKAC